MKKKEPETREKILSAATDLIREQGGSENLTMRDIAARAGVGVGLANYHFQTKENLINLCTQKAAEGFLSAFDQLRMSPGMEPLATLRALAREYVRFLSGDAGMSRASMLNALAAPSPSDGTAEITVRFLPAVLDACAGRATQTEAKMLCHLLVSSLHAALLRGGAFGSFSGIDLNNGNKGDQLADITLYILFHKYM